MGLSSRPPLPLSLQRDLCPGLRTARRFGLAGLALLAVLVAGCGGGGGPDTATTSAPVVPTAPATGVIQALDDPTVYASAAGASLPGAEEAAATSRWTLNVGGVGLSYTASAGHLIARSPTGQAQASMFVVAYTVPGQDPATRPVTFLYNGGPGSASLWLQLGSFGPKRLVTGVPGLTVTPPFALVDNAEHLLAQTDLVFINAVGTGYSQAIAPFTNQSFFGVDADAALFRDLILRYLAVHQRGASPKFLYGESYGGPRTAVLARLLQEAGVMLDGLVLQSPAMDYNSNCAVVGGGGCAGFLPSFAAVGAFHRLSKPLPADDEVGAALARTFESQRYLPALLAWQARRQPAADLWPALQDLTGLGAAWWQQDLGVSALGFRRNLLPGQLLGRYDGRIQAPEGSALAAAGDPSDTWIRESFVAAIGRHLQELGYRNASTYVASGTAISTWDFSHGGRAVPDTLPDLAAVLARQPQLRVLAISGYHDLATPFRLTETDLARVDASRVQVLNVPGGHMSYLDDVGRSRQWAGLKAFYAEALARRAAAGPARPAALAASGEARPAVPAVDRAGTPQEPGRVPVVREEALQMPRLEPWVPPQVRAAAAREAARAASREAAGSAPGASSGR